MLLLPSVAAIGMLVVEPTPRALSSEHTIDRFTSWLTLSPLNFTATAPIPVCTVAGQLGCVWPGGSATIDGVVTDLPPACNVTVAAFTEDAPDRWCANITTTGNVSRIKLYGDVLETPLYTTVSSGVALTDTPQLFRAATATACGLRPFGRYNVWAGTEAAALCRTSAVAPARPITKPPEIVPLPLSLGQTSVSFFFRIANQSAAVTHIVVRRFDPDGAVILHHYSDTQVVATVQPNITGVVFRTFTTPFNGVVVRPNTQYTLQVAIADSNFTTVTPFSANVTGTTLKAVQPKPTQATVSEIAGDRTNVRVSIPAFHPAGDTVGVQLRVYTLNTDASENTIAETNCTGACPDGVVVARLALRVELITYRILNNVGLSAPSDPAVVTATVSTTTNGDGALSGGGIAGIAVAVGVVVLLFYFAVRKRLEGPAFIRPVADPTIEIDDRTMLQVRQRLGGGSTCRVHRAIYNDEAVAAKILSTEHAAGGLEFKSFFREIGVLTALTHHGVLKIVGCVTKTDPLIILTELCVHGSLSDMLSKAEHGLHLRSCALQMVESVRYIHSREVLHRDLAARNWFVHADGTLRLGDFGMAHNLAYGASEYNVKLGRVASRWAAPATLVHNVFNYGTDVWSLSVAMHELYSQGVRPFASITSAIEVEEHIIGGGRLKPPTRMPGDIATICQALWSRDDRLTAVTVASTFPNLVIEAVV